MKHLMLVCLVIMCSCGADTSGNDSDNGDCQDGTEQIGAVGIETWCGIPNDAGGWTLHGPYTRWESGALAETGEYFDGERCGIWERIAPSGEISYHENFGPCEDPDLNV